MDRSRGFLVGVFSETVDPAASHSPGSNWSVWIFQEKGLKEAKGLEDELSADIDVPVEGWDIF